MNVRKANISNQITEYTPDCYVLLKAKKRKNLCVIGIDIKFPNTIKF